MYYDLIFQYNGQVSYEEKKKRADVPYVLKRKMDTMNEKDQSWATTIVLALAEIAPTKMSAAT